SERDEAVVRWDVERLMQAGLAWAVDAGKAFVFKHALVRDAAYNSLLRSTRQSYHRRIAATLREQFAEHILTRPDLIAYHLTNAGEDEEAIAYWEAAGEQALARAAVLEAAEPVLQMAQASGVPMLELTGRHAISFTRYCRGEYEVAIAEADAGLAYYDLDQERILAKTFGLSSAVCLRCSRANSLWMLGRLVDSDEEPARLLQLGRDLDHLPSLAAALAFHLYGLGYRYSYEDRLDQLLDVTDELLE